MVHLTSFLSDLFGLVRGIPYPFRVAARIVSKPDLTQRAQRVLESAEAAEERGELTPERHREFERDYKRAILADVLELAGVPDAMGMGADRLASVIIPPSGRVDYGQAVRILTAAPRPWSLHEASRFRIAGDPLLT